MIDAEAMKAIEDSALEKLDAMTALEKLIAYKTLYNRDYRISSMEGEIRKLAPRLEGGGR